MNKTFFLSAIVSLSFLQAGAQYYYKDIVTNKELIAEMAKLKENKYRTVKVNSFDRPEEPSVGFFCEKKINRDYTEVDMTTKAYSTTESELNSFYNKKGQIIKSVDSAEIFVNTSTYEYNANDQLSVVTIYSVSKDEDESNDAIEQHLYAYNEKKQLVTMTRVKNGKDSLNYSFTTDGKGNIIEEKDTRSGKSYYYYYDAKNRFTDVVYFNPYLLKLLPILMYDYNPQGNIAQMITAEEGSTFYYVWKYTYNDGLKISEKCYMTHQKDPLLRDSYRSLSNRELMGIIEYEYK